MLGPVVLAIAVSLAGSALSPLTHPIAANSGTPVASQAGQTPPATPPQATPEQPWPPAGVSRVGPGVTAPRVVKDVKPAYTADARRSGVQGVVTVEAVVRADGTVGEVRVLHSLDKVFGLDDEAVKAVKKWHFVPGKKDGVAVPVVVEIELTFTLRK